MQDLNGGLTLQLANERIQEHHAEATRQRLARPALPEAATERPQAPERRSFGFAAWRLPRVHVAEH